MIIYVSSPYSKGDRLCNVRKSIVIGEAISMMGHTPFLPLLNHFWNAIYPHDAKFWIEHDCKWLPFCGAVFREDGDSIGADIEVAVARKLNIPIYHKLEDIESICPHCGESGLHREFEPKLHRDLRNCMYCGYENYGRKEVR